MSVKTSRNSTKGKMPSVYILIIIALVIILILSLYLYSTSSSPHQEISTYTTLITQVEKTNAFVYNQSINLTAGSLTTPSSKVIQINKPFAFLGYFKIFIKSNISNAYLDIPEYGSVSLSKIKDYVIVPFILPGNFTQKNIFNLSIENYNTTSTVSSRLSIEEYNQSNLTYLTFLNNVNSSARVAIIQSYNNGTVLGEEEYCYSLLAIQQLAHTRKPSTIDFFIISQQNATCTYSSSGLGGQINVTNSSASSCLNRISSEPSIFINYSLSNSTIVTPSSVTINANQAFLSRCTVN